MSQAEDLLNRLTAPVINHTHMVYDSDKHFIIDPYTKQIKNTNDYKTVLMQGDHNSQCLTFELPRYIDGHDMSLCNRVILHFDNVGDSIENCHSDVAYIDDLKTNPDDSDMLVSSWLIRREATRFAGIISFFIQFQCVEDEEVTYEWNTDYYDDIEVHKKKENGEAAIIPYTNVLEQWRAHIFNAVEDPIKYTDFAGHARKLLYINANGNVVPLALGEGFRIVNGALALDIDIIESLQSLISSDGYVLLDSNGLYLKPKEVVE